MSARVGGPDYAGGIYDADRLPRGSDHLECVSGQEIKEDVQEVREQRRVQVADF